MEFFAGLVVAIMLIGTIIIVGLCALVCTRSEEETFERMSMPRRAFLEGFNAPKEIVCEAPRPMDVEEFVTTGQKLWAAREIARVAEARATCLYDVATAGEVLGALRLAIQSEEDWTDALALLMDCEE